MEAVFNPFDPAFRADPYPTYAALREAGRAHTTGIGMVVVPHYDDVARTLRSPAFSRDVERSASEAFAPRRPQLREDLGRDPATKSILNLDPPDHTRLRSLVTKAFTPRAIEAMRPRIEQLVSSRLDAMAERGTVDVVEDLAFPVPFEVISELLDMPRDHDAEVRQWSVVLTQSLEPTSTDDDLVAAMDAGASLGAFVSDVAEHRRAHLGDDVLSGLLVAEEAGDRLSMPELVTMVVLLYVAGHETTVNLIGNGLMALLRNRDQLERWREDPTLDAVDELLRYDGPVQHTVRVPLEDVTYGDVTVAAGTPVLVLLGSSNHDPAMFTDPDRLVLGRPDANRHLAFAAGIHYCLGSSLAKAEAEIALGSLIRRFPAIELAGEPRWRDRLTIRGVAELPVSL